MIGRIRFSLATLMGVVLLAAFGFAALRAATPLWASATFSAAVLFLLTAVVGAVVRRGRSRATWFGAALFGWAYLAASFSPWPWLNNEGLRPPPLLTAILLEHYRETRLQPEVFAWIHAGNPMIISTVSNLSVLNRGVTSMPGLGVISTTTPLKQTGHSLLSMVLAVLGAMVGRLLAPDDDLPPPR